MNADVRACRETQGPGPCQIAQRAFTEIEAPAALTDCGTGQTQTPIGRRVLPATATRFKRLAQLQIRRCSRHRYALPLLAPDGIPSLSRNDKIKR